MDKLKRINSVAVFCGSKTPTDPAIGEAAMAFGTFLAKHRIDLVFGGSNAGVMKILADSVRYAGGRAIGVFPDNLPHNLAYEDANEIVHVHSLAERKDEMRRLADAVVALPGGLGTLDELFDSLALRRVKYGGHKKPVGLLNVNGYYDKLLEFLEHSRSVGFSSNAAVLTLQVGKTPEELFKRLAGSLPPLDKIDPDKRGSLKALWREMAKHKAIYGYPQGASFANAFYRRVKDWPLEAWRDCGDEIAYAMLTWVDGIDKEIWSNLDCSWMEPYDWVESAEIDGRVLSHPQCPVDDIEPLDLLYLIHMDIGNLAYFDGDKLAARLLPEHRKHFFWTEHDAETARQLGYSALANWFPVEQ